MIHRSFFSIFLLFVVSCAPGGPDRFEQLFEGKLEMIDLNHPVNAQSQFFSASEESPFTVDTVIGYAQGYFARTFCVPEHFSTHIDAPNHFEPEQPAVDLIPLSHLFAPAVKIDVSEKTKNDVDYELTPDDIEQWESDHGRIPFGSIVLLRTGWDKYWNDAAKYRGVDAEGKFHFPGYSREAAELLVNERKVKALGIDNLSIDRGPSTDFASHHVLNVAGGYALENLAHLADVPAIGSYTIVAPMKLEGGSGGPVRVLVVVP
ncbi:MAG: cyclase family protein [Bacteroidota bacterium]